MKKKSYQLKDIEKILTFVPPLFIVAFAILALITLFITIEFRQNSKIELYHQQQHFLKENYLKEYAHLVKKNVDKNLANIEDKLKRSVYLANGIAIGLSESRDKSFAKNTFINRVKELERSSNIKFLIFDKNYSVEYGEDIAQSITSLIFGKKVDKEHIRVTLMYISSQGSEVAMSWRNDLTQTIQLSYFVYNSSLSLYIGAFSSIDYFKNLTTTAYINAISSAIYNPEGFYFWVYDKDEKRVYNLDNKLEWKLNKKPPKESVLYDLKRYNLSIGISRKDAFYDNKEILKIKQSFNSKRESVASIIIVVMMILLLFTVIFSNYIKKIFSYFNKNQERKSKQISRLKERYELAIIASNDGLWDSNFKSNKTFFSKKWLDMLGYKKSDMNSFKDWLNIIHPNDLKRVKQELANHIKNSNSGHFICEYRLKKQNGEYIWVLGRGKAFVDKDGKIARLSMMSMDIDEKKEADKKLKALVEKEVEKNEKKRRLLIQQNKMAAMGEMIGAIAHQWRQPLNNISLVLYFIRDNAKNREFIEQKLDSFINRALSQIEYMSNTIDDFRYFFQPSKAKREFKVIKAIKSSINIIESSLEKNGIRVNISGEEFSVYGYENEFKQAILNILSNAKDAIVSKKSQKGEFQGKIVITLDGNSIKIYNNGGNAKQDVLERMFEPYFTTKFEDKGTGIGLYMTKMIIEKSMNGEIIAQNKDEGVEFIIRFSND